MKPGREKNIEWNEMEDPVAEDMEIVRYNLRERLVHWTVAASFLYLLLSGLALYSPRLYWLSYIMGGGTNIRIWHPYAGVVFFLSVTIMAVSWRRCMWLYHEDWKWIRYTWNYITHKDGVPESARFNAGQKGLFWMQDFGGLWLLLSGIVLWFPENFHLNFRLASILTHEVFAIAAMGCIIVHIYMGLFACPGALRAMIEGRVSGLWARVHHARWYRRIMGGT